LQEALRRAGSHKLIFGSDGPWTHPALELAKVDLLGLRAAARQRITSDNARMLLGLGSRELAAVTNIAAGPFANIDPYRRTLAYSPRRSTVRRDWRVRGVTPSRAAASF
jgi:hypothetical protein